MLTITSINVFICKGMMGVQVYVGLGGNIGDTVSVLNLALEKIYKLPQVWDLRCSSFYLTSPVGMLEDRDFVNAVCRFKTTLSAKELHTKLRQIEVDIGKMPKPKHHSRVIDLDLIFFGQENFCEEDLIIPHLSWYERMFVLKPLLDLTNEIDIPLKNGEKGTLRVNLQDRVNTLANSDEQRVTFLTKPQLDFASFFDKDDSNSI